MLTNRGTFFLGVANPKAYLAFASLFGSFELVSGGGGWADGSLKWFLCVGVMAVVDVAWLTLGMTLGRVGLPGRSERLLNIGMAVIIVFACAATWL